MTFARRQNLAPLSLLLLTSACQAIVETDGGVRLGGLTSEPEQLAFTCVTPGCDQSLSARITVLGSRRVAIKRVLLDGAAHTDFTLTTSERPPFIVGAGAGFDVQVRYQPLGAPAPGVVRLLVTYTDASAEDDPNRIAPGELEVPLLRRLVGAPALTVNPARVSFGAVTAGQTKTATLALKNVGFGNIALEVTAIDAGTGADGLSVALPTARTMLADAGIDVSVAWAPTQAAYLRGQLQIFTSAPEVPVTTVDVEGTSLTTPRIAVEPSDTIDFGEVVKTQERRLTLSVLNQGGSALAVTGVSFNDVSGNLSLFGPDGGAIARDGGVSYSVGPLQRLPLTLALKGLTAGDLRSADGGTSVITIRSNDANTSALPVTVLGTVTEPRATATPATLAFGSVPQGWVVTKPVEVRNTGFGSLTVKNISFVAGTNNLFTLSDKPTLPMQLQRNQRLAFQVEFRAETMAAATGSISIETDDPEQPFLEVPMTAASADCLTACPIANGMPNCSMGVCTVGMCNTNYFDADQQAANGCECKEGSANQSQSNNKDPGAFCASSADMGTLDDTQHQSVSFTGNLPIDGDVDIISFYASDSSALGFSDDYNVRVRLDSSDPNISMCVYRAPNAPSQGCALVNETCPSNRTYSKGGSLGSEDGADYAVKVFRKAGAAPTCTTYTVFMSNG